MSNEKLESRIKLFNGGTDEDFSLWEIRIEGALNGRDRWMP